MLEERPVGPVSHFESSDMGLPGVDENWWDNSPPSLTHKVNEAVATVRKVLCEALSGTNAAYIYDGKHTRWGLVEQHICEAIQRILETEANQ